MKNDDGLLEKALAVDPNFAEAHFLLGVRETDRGEYAAAIEHLQRAVAIEPRRFTYWHALGYAQAKVGRPPGSSRVGAKSLHHRRDRARGTNGGFAHPTGVGRAGREKKAGPNVITPPSWQNPKGDTRLEGTLTRVDCQSLPVTLAVSSAGKTIELIVQDPTAVQLVNAEGASTVLVCGAQSQPVTVEYNAASKEITRIEFKHVVIMKR